MREYGFLGVRWSGLGNEELLAIVIVMFVSWVVLRQTDRIYGMLGRTGAAVIARIMSLFIAAIAVQYILAGIQFYYPPR